MPLGGQNVYFDSERVSADALGEKKMTILESKKTKIMPNWDQKRTKMDHKKWTKRPN